MTTHKHDAADSATAASNSGEAVRPAKKRRLRPPGDAFKLESGPTDDPALHKGRSRAVPHIEGQWSTHIYLEPEGSTTLIKTLEAAVAQLEDVLKKKHDIDLHSMLTGGSGQCHTLHLSLSRPIQLWTGQRAAFISACRAALKEMTSFKMSFAFFEILTNDERTRSFLVCEVGYGHDKLLALTNVFNEVLEKKHLPKYYAEPRFHISIGWWLHKDDKLPSAHVMKDLNDRLGASLRKQVLVASHVELKIGKDVTSIHLLQG